DDLSFFGDLEEAAEGRFRDQSVAVWQPLRAAHARREEVPSRSVLVFPHNGVCGRIDLDGSRIRHRVVKTMRPVVEDHDVAALEQGRGVLACWGLRPERPKNLAGLARDANDCGGWPIAGQNLAVR